MGGRVVALLIALSVVQAAAQVAPPPPVLTIDGLPYVEATLRISGMPSDASIRRRTYQWYSLTSDVEALSADSAIAIGGATSPTYQLRVPDEGRYIRVQVVITRDSGIQTLVSEPTKVIGSVAGIDPPPLVGDPWLGGTIRYDFGALPLSHPFRQTEVVATGLAWSRFWVNNDADKTTGNEVAPSPVELARLPIGHNGFTLTYRLLHGSGDQNPPRPITLRTGKFLNIFVLEDGPAPWFQSNITFPDVVIGETDLCGRSPQIRNAILAAINANLMSSEEPVTCISATVLQMAAIETLVLEYSSGVPLRRIEVSDLGGSDESDIPNLLPRLSSLTISGHGLESLPSGIFTRLVELTSLDLSDNNLSEIPADTFASLSRLEVLLLSDNKLTSLAAGAFNGLSALLTLRLNDNELTSIPIDTFNGLGNLQTLDLRANSSLISLVNDSFRGLGELQVLTINGHKLTTIEGDTFAGLRKLNTLSLEGGALTSIQANAFRGLGELTSLGLSGNPTLASIESNAFTGLRQMRSLTLTGTALTSIPGRAFEGMDALEELSLVANDSLASIESNAFAGLGALTSLGLSGNPALASIESNAFTGLSKLPSLTLTNTKLTSIPTMAFEGMDALTTLDLSSNSRLTSIASNAFAAADSLTGLAQLTSLDLSGHALERLRADTFAGLGALTTLTLPRARASTTRTLELIEANAFRGLDSLQTLDLSGHDLREIQIYAFSGLDQLLTLNLSDNPLSDGPSSPRVMSFLGLTGLTSIDVSNSSVGEIGFVEHLFRDLPSLVTLTANSANLFTIPNLEGLGNLRTVNFRSNPLTVLNTHLSALSEDLPDLQTLDLSGSSGFNVADPYAVFADLNVSESVANGVRIATISPSFPRFVPSSVFANASIQISLAQGSQGDVSYSVGGAERSTVAVGETLIVTQRGAAPALLNASLSGAASANGLTAGVASSFKLFEENLPATGQVAITGNVYLGNALGIRVTDLADPDGFPSVGSAITGYQWHRGATADFTPNRLTTIAGATSEGYTTGAPLQVGEYLRVVITVRDARAGSSTDLTSPSVRLAQTNLCSRSQVVSSAIQRVLLATNVSDPCINATAEHLAGIRSLLVEPTIASDLMALRSGDFAGLTGLTSLSIVNSSLSPLPNSIFAEQRDLTSLTLTNNNLSSFDFNVLAPLVNLVHLDLSGNATTSFAVPFELIGLNEALVEGARKATVQLQLPRYVPASVRLAMANVNLSSGVANLARDGTVVSQLPLQLSIDSPIVVTQLGSGVVMLSASALTPAPVANGITVADAVDLTLFERNVLPSGALTINGTPQTNQLLTADASGISDSDGLGAFSYAWHRGDESGFDPSDDSLIPVNSGPTYRLEQADAGRYIKVVLSYTDRRGTPETLTSTATGEIAPDGNTLVTGVPVITGLLANVASVGRTLGVQTSGIADVDGLGAFSYQWHRGGASDFTPSALTAVSGATGLTYLLTDADLSSYIVVEVSFTDGRGTGESVRSQPPLQITARMANELPQGAITITGDPRVGRELSFENTITDANGLGTFSYQWHRGATSDFTPSALTAIAGATGLTYLLVEADEDSYIAVEATFTRR